MGIYIKIQYTARAEKRIKKLYPKQKNIFEEKIRKIVSDFISGDNHKNIRKARVGGIMGYESTLYLAKIDLRHLVLLTIDEDPIFEQVIVTIFALCTPDNYMLEIRGVQESIYQQMINEGEEDFING